VQAEKAQQVTKKRIEDAKNITFERLQLDVRRELIAEEVEVRALAAEHHFARREFEHALAHLDRVLQADPRRFVDYYNRGKVLLELGRRQEADADFRRFLADPSLPVTSEKAAFAMKVLGQ
jgi:tetratricopeptide (TPR) repeat protein